MKYSAIALLVIGLLQMTGDLLDRAGMKSIGQPIKAIGAATTASPAPKVFMAVRGLETFSTRFDLEWHNRTGERHTLTLTPEINARIRGPYNRRNVYGAALAFGPVLAADERTQPLLRSVMRYSLGRDAPLLRELGVDPGQIAGPVRIRYQPREGAKLDEHLPQVLEADRP
jgi:hypothetical protein